MENDLRKWMRLVEGAEEINDLIEQIIEIFEGGYSGANFWLMEDGEVESCSVYTHSNFAWMCFGDAGNFKTISGAKSWEKYGKLFPTWWPRKSVSYAEVAMAHGWIRLIVNAKTKGLYINIIKGKAALPAKRTLMALIKKISPYIQEYVVEYTDGSNAGINTVTPDARKAFGLINAR